MWPKKLFWQLYCSYLLLVGVPVTVITWYSADSFTKFYRTQMVEDLKARANLIGAQVENCLPAASRNTVDSLCKALGKKIQNRFTVIGIDGTVLGDSHSNPDSMENHGSRPEVISALRGQPSVSERFSFTLSENMVYVALPAYSKNKIAAVIRTSFPVYLIEQALYRLYYKIAVVVFLTALFAAILSYLVSRSISRPISQMKIGAQRFASGDFSFKLSADGYEEANQLASDLNEMARQLHERLATITEQRNERDAVLSSMIEGVIAIDADEKILTVNSAAEKLFSITQEKCKGKWIGEALRNTEVHEFLLRALRSSIPVEKELALPIPGQIKETEPLLYLQLHGNALHDTARKAIGALMVVNDISKIKKLENIRKDFVANVSHELRTPLTSIKGYVETLQCGAMNNPQEAVKFLGIIANQVERINSIVDDLLSLSRIERDSEVTPIDLVMSSVRDLLTAAMETCRHKASAKAISLELDCDASFQAKMEKSLLEQAIVNLIDNAINYSEEKRKVVISVREDAVKKDIVISVCDEGIGIPHEHLERIFERFYRVDKARSRKLGGTGLGLSIVKHIVLAHGGMVSVTSVPGKGSTFAVHLPLLSRA